jgi:hypothetical protein
MSFGATRSLTADEIQVMREQFEKIITAHYPIHLWSRDKTKGEAQAKRNAAMELFDSIITIDMKKLYCYSELNAMREQFDVSREQVLSQLTWDRMSEYQTLVTHIIAYRKQLQTILPQLLTDLRTYSAETIKENIESIIDKLRALKTRDHQCGIEAWDAGIESLRIGRQHARRNAETTSRMLAAMGGANVTTQPLTTDIDITKHNAEVTRIEPPALPPYPPQDETLQDKLSHELASDLETAVKPPPLPPFPRPGSSGSAQE